MCHTILSALILSKMSQVWIAQSLQIFNIHGPRLPNVFYVQNDGHLELFENKSTCHSVTHVLIKFDNLSNMNISKHSSLSKSHSKLNSNQSGQSYSYLCTLIPNILIAWAITWYRCTRELYMNPNYICVTSYNWTLGTTIFRNLLTLHPIVWQK